LLTKTHTNNQRIRELNIIPADAKGDPTLIRGFATQFAMLPQSVAINVPNLIMWTVLCAVRQREHLAAGHVSGNEGTRQMILRDLRQTMLDLTAYTSQLRYRFPPHLHEALARASVE